MSTTSMSIRVDNDIKEKAKKVFNALGLDMSTAVNVFLRRSVIENGMPFELTLDVPNRETKKVLQDAEKGVGMSKTFSSTKELFKELEI